MAAEKGALKLHLGADHLAAAVRRAHESDAALTADVFFENLAGKASATLALLRVLHDNGIDPASIDYVIGSGEEAIGDRYQRGGGNLGKSVAAAAGCVNASGCDVKNFCAAPLPALVIASSLVEAGVFQRVAVVAGGSLPKVGMKFQGHLKHDLPVLEDVLGASALIVEADDGRSPRVRLDSVGKHPVAAGSSNPKIMEALVVRAARPAEAGVDRRRRLRHRAAQPRDHRAPGLRQRPRAQLQDDRRAGTAPGRHRPRGHGRFRRRNGGCPASPRRRVISPRPSATFRTPEPGCSMGARGGYS